MNVQETAALLAKIKLGDNREVTELVIAEWHDTIGHLDYGDAINAVRVHRQESTDYLMPAHLIRIIARVRERRLPPRALPTAESCTHKFLAGWCVHCGEKAA